MKRTILSAQPRDADPAVGELVVLNGRQSGARRELAAPVMFIGRATGCDVRLNVEGIEPFHCVLGVRHGEVTLRDLHSGLGTFVNGQRISAALLRDGDLLDIGPFRFRVLLPVVAATIDRPERDAVRIQVAAVVAQQAALDEQEARLVEQADKLAAAQQRVDAARLAWERECAEARAVIEQERAAARAELEQAAARREPLAAEERRLGRRAAWLDQVKAELQYKEGALALEHVRVNTQREVDSRLLQDGWQCLERDQQRWRQRRGRESVALRLRRTLLAEAERKLAGRRAEIMAEQQAWLTQRHLLESELHGLNSRVLHQRQVLAQQEAACRTLVVSAADAEAPVAPPTRPAELERLAGELADQRAQLLEQWERLARMHHDWHAQRAEAAAELETLGEQLARHDEALGRREQNVETAEARLRTNQEQLDWLRRQAALALARSEAQRQTFEAERAELLETTTRHSDQARGQLEALGALRRKWNQRRQQETEALRTERQTLTSLRVELTHGRQELEEQAALLESARRAVAEEVQALEHNAEKPLRRRWLRLNGAVVRALRQQREALKKDLAQLQTRQEELAAQADRLAHAQTASHEQQAALEHREARLGAAQAALKQRERDAELRRAATERRLAALQEESELLARALIPDGEEAAVALERAA